MTYIIYIIYIHTYTYTVYILNLIICFKDLIILIRQAVVRKRMEAGKEAKAAYGKRLAEYRHELKERHAAEVAKKKAKKN